jgi:hypothetical protein
MASAVAAPLLQAASPENVVEVGLLLPVEWASALIELSKKRQESVGQLIRTCIGRVLTENDAVS